MSKDSLGAWVEQATGHRPRDASLFELALTHASKSGDNYERLEFLGDRVLGLAVATRLFNTFPDEPEGRLSRRFAILVSRPVCGEVGREIGLPAQMRLGKQAREDGAQESDNVIGNAVEALIGAIFLDGGYEAAERVVVRLWEQRVDQLERAPLHPKSALQEWAAANRKRLPDYRIVGRSGPDHAPSFKVEVAIRGAGQAQGEGTTRAEAEAAAAEALLKQIG
ncbi:MAG: ribonuclease III [Sphingosinicella sp.]